MTAMKPKDYARMLERDQACLHCGTTEGLVPNHRANRGMGGSRVLERPSNVVTLCSLINDLIESNDGHARLARVYGWKLRPWEEPEDTPVYDRVGRTWYMLDNEWDRTATEGTDD